MHIIGELRKVFGDGSRHPRFIRTVPKVGYHFIAPVSELPPARETALVEIEEVTTVQVEVERTIDTPPPTLLPTRPGLWPRLTAAPRQRIALVAASG